MDHSPSFPELYFLTELSSNANPAELIQIIKQLSKIEQVCFIRVGTGLVTTGVWNLIGGKRKKKKKPKCEVMKYKHTHTHCKKNLAVFM